MHPPLENDLAELWRAIVNGQVEQSVKGKVWTLKESSTLKWHGDITSLYIRDEYKRIFRELVAKRNTNVLVVGTPGIGKSSFLNYVLVKIGELEGKASGSTIVFSKYSGGEKKHYLLRMDGTSYATTVDSSDIRTCTYRLSDSVDIDSAPTNKFNLEVSSTSNLNYKEFEKLQSHL